MPSHIAFLGLGAMGAPIARHLADKGTERVTAVDPDPARLAGLAGPRLDATADRSRMDGAEVLFLCLPDGDVVEAVLFGADRVAERLAPGALVVDLSTIAHAQALRIGRTLAAGGRRFLDAPISGAPAGAEAGTLTVMCGGAAEDFAAARPLLDRFGATVLHMGPAGAGQLTKTVNNVLYDIHIAALAEVLPMAVAMGLDPATLGQVVTTGTSRSYASQYFVPRILKGEFDEGYPLGKAYKDLVSAAAVAAENGFPLPVTAAATATYQTALRQGHGDRDKGAMILPFEDLLGVSVRGGERWYSGGNCEAIALCYGIAMRDITYSREAVRALARMPTNTSRLIREKIELYAMDPSSLANNVKALKGEPGVLRLRVGDWRVLFTEDGVVVAVIRIAPRGTAYDR